MTADSFLKQSGLIFLYYYISFVILYFIHPVYSAPDIPHLLLAATLFGVVGIGIVGAMALLTLLFKKINSPFLSYIVPILVYVGCIFLWLLAGSLDEDGNGRLYILWALGPIIPIIFALKVLRVKWMEKYR